MKKIKQIKEYGSWQGDYKKFPRSQRDMLILSIQRTVRLIANTQHTKKAINEKNDEKCK
jgi:hypothetical protein